ncbi:MAG: Hsp20/alpha crystallin family protein [Bacteroidota bacterium]
MFYRKPLNTRVFHRIGNSYANFIDGDHFLGRNSLDDNWMTHRTPVSNISKTNSEYVISLSLPEYRKEDIEVVIENDELKLKASSTNDYPVYQTYELPKDVILDGIEAKFDHNILVITIERGREVENVRSIAIQ